MPYAHAPPCLVPLTFCVGLCGLNAAIAGMEETPRLQATTRIGLSCYGALPCCTSVLSCWHVRHITAVCGPILLTVGACCTTLLWIWCLGVLLSTSTWDCCAMFERRLSCGVVCTVCVKKQAHFGAHPVSNQASTHHALTAFGANPPFIALEEGALSAPEQVGCSY